MCGIVGFIGEGSLSDLQTMANKIQHRGPDANGFWQDIKARVNFGHQRLSIIDIESGQQPMLNAEKNVCIVFNGEIYNHIELKHELVSKGYRFQTDHSDTEVLLQGYICWGESIVNKLNGMWSFAIWDRNMNKLFCSRDRMGQKPLFYSNQMDNFVFASELDAMLEYKHIPRGLSKLGLKKYFAYGYIPAPNTIIKDVFSLPAGHNLTFYPQENKLQIREYWSLEIDPFLTIPTNPEEVWGEELRFLLEQSVERRLMADVELGVFLSGGVDSSAIASFAKKLKPDIKTFCIGFEEKSFDESQYAQRVADLLSTNHFTSTLSINKAIQILPDIISRFEPMGDSSIIPTYLLSEFARKQVLVALGGDGGDELFAGYDPFKALAKAKLYHQLMPKSIHSAIKWIFAFLPVSHRNMSLDFKIKRTLRGLSYPRSLWLPSWMSPLSIEELSELFNEKIDIEDLYSEAIHSWNNCTQDNLIDKTLQFYTKLYLQEDIHCKADRASMMHSLELRSPFMDIDLINFVRRIPANYKYRNGQTKYILKKALEPILPNDILYRAKKGFGVPIGSWFKQKKLTIMKSDIPHISSAFVEKNLQKHIDGKADNRAFLWQYWLLQSILKKKWSGINEPSIDKL